MNYGAGPGNLKRGEGPYVLTELHLGVVCAGGLWEVTEGA